MKDVAARDMGGALISVNPLAATNSTNWLTGSGSWHSTWNKDHMFLNLMKWATAQKRGLNTI